MTVTNCDIAIIGGGPVGAALALALQDNDLNVVLLEARDTPINTTDPRALALSYGTRLLLQRLGAWASMQNVSGIKTIEVTQKNSSGHTLLRADELKVPEMGYVLPYTTLHAALQQGLQQSDITCLYGASGRRPARRERWHHPHLPISGKRTHAHGASRSRRRRRQIAGSFASAANPGLRPERHHRPHHQLAAAAGCGFRAFHRRRGRWRCCPIWMDTNWC